MNSSTISYSSINASKAPNAPWIITTHHWQVPSTTLNTARITVFSKALPLAVDHAGSVSHTDLIVACVVGGLAGIVLLLGVFFYFFSKKSKYGKVLVD